MKNNNYDDPRWKRKSWLAKERDNWTCQWCRRGRDADWLHAHHLRYERDGEIWDSPLEDLLTLCRPCHDYLEAAKTAVCASACNGKYLADVVTLITAKDHLFPTAWQGGKWAAHTIMEDINHIQKQKEQVDETRAFGRVIVPVDFRQESDMQMRFDFDGAA